MKLARRSEVFQLQVLTCVLVLSGNKRTARQRSRPTSPDGRPALDNTSVLPMLKAAMVVAPADYSARVLVVQQCARDNADKLLAV